MNELSKFLDGKIEVPEIQPNAEKVRPGRAGIVMISDRGLTPYQVANIPITRWDPGVHPWQGVYEGPSQDLIAARENFDREALDLEAPRRVEYITKIF